MPKYSLTIKNKVEKYILSLPVSDKNRIFDKLLLLSIGSFELCDIKKMHGSNPLLYRLRVGDFRIIYEKHDDRLIIVVVKIGSRGDVYK
ncbi:MAG: type II toxin-antitoxin system RelE/ParE family toxin [Candidatus Gracilibacteria bacterium]|nr:type II toxin-antitoxin system RelE/ParE family toxin [Candidatus Gracilibacteria bacterium]